MLTKITVRNFKRFAEETIDLGDPVVFIGPNNSGKTSALQALALWWEGLRRWNEARQRGKATRLAPERRRGVTINRRDLIAVPVPDAALLWRNRKSRTGLQNGTQNVRIEVIVEGVTDDQAWACGLEFDYANPESIYCRPLRNPPGIDPPQMPIPEGARRSLVAFLPPMSGLAGNETKLEEGAVNVRIGEGRTAEVLRNLCNTALETNPDGWGRLKHQIRHVFGVDLENPTVLTGRGEIEMAYRENGIRLDLSSSGRGLQQTLLLLAYMYTNNGAILLLDEPDAHLEILRQREIYHLLTETAIENNNQLVIASHSEVLLNEAAEDGTVIAFVGKPHLINNRKAQLLKALREIGWEDYYLAEQVGWVLYLEGSTDLAILKVFAERLAHHTAMATLQRPFVHYVGNQTQKAADHYFGVREAVPRLRAVALFDSDASLPNASGPIWAKWSKREIESYVCYPESLMAYAEASAMADDPAPLFGHALAETRKIAMKHAIQQVESALQTLGDDSPWNGVLKVSDQFLPRVFDLYFRELRLPNVMSKGNYYDLARLVPIDVIDDEIKAKLDIIGTLSSI